MATSKAHVLKLAGELTLRQASELCERLHAAVADHPHVVVEVAEDSEIDLSVVQLFLAAFKSAEMAGKRLSVSFSSGGALNGVLGRAGLLTADGAPLAGHASLWARTTG